MNRIIESIVAASLIGSVFSLGFCCLVGVWVLTGTATPNVATDESVVIWWATLYGCVWTAFMATWASIALLCFVRDAVGR